MLANVYAIVPQVKADIYDIPFLSNDIHLSDESAFMVN